MSPEDFGPHLRSLRMRARIPLNDVAEALGVSHSHLSRCERGVRSHQTGLPVMHSESAYLLVRRVILNLIREQLEVLQGILEEELEPWEG